MAARRSSSMLIYFSSLNVFGHFSLALDWLFRDYALSASSFKVNASIIHLKVLERQMRGGKPTGAGLASSIRASQMADVGMYMSWLNQRHVQLLIERQANERDALSIGMHFLDASLSGYLEVRHQA